MTEPHERNPSMNYRNKPVAIESIPHPAWRIEHDHMNLRIGEYIIDRADDDGTVTHEWITPKWGTHWDTDGTAYGARCFAPFIVFSDKHAATPEAIKEAKRARGKELNT